MRTKCINGIKANIPALKRKIKYFAGIATALSPYIGYEKAAKIAKESQRTGIPVITLVKKYKLLTPKQIENILAPEMMTKPNMATNS